MRSVMPTIIFFRDTFLERVCISSRSLLITGGGTAFRNDRYEGGGMRVLSALSKSTFYSTSNDPPYGSSLR